MSLLKGFLILLLVFVFAYLVEAKDNKPPKIKLVTVTGVLYKLASHDESTGWLLELKKPLKIGLRTKKYVIELEPGTGEAGFENMFEKYKYCTVTVKGSLKTVQGKRRGEYYTIGVAEMIIGD